MWECEGNSKLLRTLTLRTAGRIFFQSSAPGMMLTTAVSRRTTRDEQLCNHPAEVHYPPHSTGREDPFRLPSLT